MTRHVARTAELHVEKVAQAQATVSGRCSQQPAQIAELHAKYRLNPSRIGQFTAVHVIQHRKQTLDN